MEIGTIVDFEILVQKKNGKFKRWCRGSSDKDYSQNFLEILKIVYPKKKFILIKREVISNGHNRRKIMKEFNGTIEVLKTGAYTALTAYDETINYYEVVVNGFGVEFTDEKLDYKIDSQMFGLLNAILGTEFDYEMKSYIEMINYLISLVEEEVDTEPVEKGGFRL